MTEKLTALKIWLLAIPGVLVEYGQAVKTRWEIVVIAAMTAFCIPVGSAIWWTKYDPSNIRVILLASVAAFIAGFMMSGHPRDKTEADTIWNGMFWGIIVGAAFAVFVVFHPF